MISTREQTCKDLGMIYCDNCGYCNQKAMVDKYGVCKGCGRVLDKKAKYDYEMYERLHLWSRKGIGNRFKF